MAVAQLDNALDKRGVGRRHRLAVKTDIILKPPMRACPPFATHHSLTSIWWRPMPAAHRSLCAGIAPCGVVCAIFAHTTPSSNSLDSNVFFSAHSHGTVSEPPPHRSPSIRRASPGVTIGLSWRWHSSTTRSTSAALDGTSVSRSRWTLSSSPVRACPPFATHHSLTSIWWRPMPAAHRSLCAGIAP